VTDAKIEFEDIACGDFMPTFVARELAFAFGAWLLADCWLASSARTCKKENEESRE
jgi:hypothetical protein